MYAYTTTLTSYKLASDFPDVDTRALGATRVVSGDGSLGVVVTVFEGALACVLWKAWFEREEG